MASSLTLSRKLLHHDYCNLKIGWDEQLPSDLATKWAKWESRSPERITFMRALGVVAAALTIVSQPSGVTQGIVAANP